VLNLNATLQDTEFTEHESLEGKEVRRQPAWQLRLTPSYEFDLGQDQYLTLYGTVSAVDDRISDYDGDLNPIYLDSYEKVDIGFIYEPTEHLNVQLSVDNLTDEQGLTEGDPRTSGAPNGRYILPRSIKLSVSYEMF